MPPAPNMARNLVTSSMPSAHTRRCCVINILVNVGAIKDRKTASIGEKFCLIV